MNWWIAFGLFDVAAGATALIIVRVGSRKPWPYIPPAYRCTFTNQEVIRNHDNLQGL